MNYLLLSLVAAGASLLSFYSGFGLGTLLTPVFAIFFPIDVAIALTAIVHFLNGLFKLSLIGKFTHLPTFLRFGLPAIVSAAVGAWILSQVSDWPPLFSYEIGQKTFIVMPIKLLMAFLIASFTLFELIPRLKNMQIDSKYLSLGGVLSGFFGGLSGHQGALRSAFLTRLNLSKEQFIATGTAIGSIIDVTRLGLYLKHFSLDHISPNFLLLTVTTLSAFSGAFLGNKLLTKMTMKSIQLVVSVCLFLLAIALGLGFI
jgi:uncharacterized membrane protein YfcA